jgi:hypothetical protein
MTQPMDHEEVTGVLARPLFPRPGPGRLGAIAARAGEGKTACLVRFALGELVAGRRVLHVSLNNPVADVRAAYDAKLDALHAQDPAAIPHRLRVEIERRRMIHSFLRGSFAPPRLADALRFLSEHADFEPDTVVLDDLSLERTTLDDVAALGAVAEGAGAELWLAARAHRDEPRDQVNGLPASIARVAELLEVVVSLEPRGDEVRVYLLKRGGRLVRELLPLRLDPATALLVHDDGTRDEPAERR